LQPFSADPQPTDVIPPSPKPDSLDPDLPFLFANCPPHQIERIFRILDFAPGDRPAALRRLAAQHEEPGTLPNEFGGEPRDPADEYTPISDFCGYDEYDNFEDSHCQHGGVSFASSARSERAGFGLELWPPARLERAQPLYADQLIHEERFPNLNRIMRLEEFQSIARKCELEIVARISVANVRNFLNEKKNAGCDRDGYAIAVEQ
jgi:hypothetical protein